MVFLPRQRNGFSCLVCHVRANACNATSASPSTTTPREACPVHHTMSGSKQVERFLDIDASAANKAASVRQTLRCLSKRAVLYVLWWFALLALLWLTPASASSVCASIILVVGIGIAFAIARAGNAAREAAARGALMVMDARCVCLLPQNTPGFSTWLVMSFNAKRKQWCPGFSGVLLELRTVRHQSIDGAWVFSCLSMAHVLLGNAVSPCLQLTRRLRARLRFSQTFH
mgnify:CR=1 FL=1